MRTHLYCATLHHFYYYYAHLYHFYTRMYYINMYIQTHIRLHSCFLFIPSRYYFIHQPSHKKYTPTIYPHYRKFTLSHFSFPYGSATIYFDFLLHLLLISIRFDSIRFEVHGWSNERGLVGLCRLCGLFHFISLVLSVFRFIWVICDFSWASLRLPLLHYFFYDIAAAAAAEIYYCFRQRVCVCVYVCTRGFWHVAEAFCKSTSGLDLCRQSPSLRATRLGRHCRHRQTATRTDRNANLAIFQLT